MTDSKHYIAEAGALEGRVFRPGTPLELAETIEQAFDYRGDVILELTSGETLEGYLFNREPSGGSPFVEMFPNGRSGASRIYYRDVVSVAFTGKDTASGKSWEAWIAKKESQRRAEAEQTAAEARARGHL